MWKKLLEWVGKTLLGAAVEKATEKAAEKVKRP